MEKGVGFTLKPRERRNLLPARARLAQPISLLRHFWQGPEPSGLSTRCGLVGTKPPGCAATPAPDAEAAAAVPSCATAVLAAGGICNVEGAVTAAEAEARAEAAAAAEAMATLPPPFSMTGCWGA